jgi:hypothetical protein
VSLRHTARRAGARSWRFAVLTTAFALLLLGCTVPSATPKPGVAAPALPLATSVVTTGGSWAALPMGHLGQVTGTFWQLLVERPGSGHFVVATPPGVADNGGLVSAPGNAGTFEVGFLTSELLGFSPTASSSDAGRHWTGAVLPEALTPVPNPLATSGAAPPTALFGRDGATVMSDRRGTGWRRSTDLAALARAAAGRCGLEALTAVAHVGSGGATTIIGGECRNGGRPALFAESGGSFTDLGASLASTEGSGRDAAVEVIAIEADPSRAGGAYDVIGLSRIGAVTSVVVWHAGAGAPSTPPAQLALPAGHELRAIGMAENGEILVLDTGGSPAAPRHERVAAIGFAAHSWQFLVTPPAGTEDVVSVRDRIEALAVDRSRLTVYRFTAGQQWLPLEVIHVSIPFGSSG